MFNNGCKVNHFWLNIQREHQKCNINNQLMISYTINLHKKQRKWLLISHQNLTK